MLSPADGITTLSSTQVLKIILYVLKATRHYADTRITAWSILQARGCCCEGNCSSSPFLPGALNPSPLNRFDTATLPLPAAPVAHLTHSGIQTHSDRATLDPGWAGTLPPALEPRAAPQKASCLIWGSNKIKPQAKACATRLPASLSTFYGHEPVSREVKWGLLHVPKGHICTS